MASMGCAQRTVVSLPWGDVEYLHHGDGPPVVLLHRDLGPIGTRTLVDELRPSHSVYALSLPGFGASTLPSWARNVAHVAALVGHALDHLAVGPVPVIGLGFGGWVASELAAYAPSHVRALALVSPMGVKPACGEVADQFLYSAARYGALSAGSADDFAAPVDELDADAVDEYLDRSREAVTRVAWKPIGHDPALVGLLGSVNVPVSLQWGSDDAVVPVSTATQWARLLRTERVTIIEGAPHHVELTHAATVAAELVAFLGSLDCGER